MTLLALDCATDAGSVAVGDPGTPAAEIVVAGRRHAADLIPAAEECLRRTSRSWSDLTGVLVADGPGSFTGLRIAFATAAGVLRHRADVPLLTAPSLLSAAWIGSRQAGPTVAALFDALRGEVYAAIYQFGERVQTLMAPGLTTVASLVESGISPELAVGDGVTAYAASLRSWTGRDPVPPPAGAPRASALIELAARGAVRRVADLSTWEPTYGRPAEAQARWEKTHGRRLPGPAGG